MLTNGYCSAIVGIGPAAGRAMNFLMKTSDIHGAGCSSELGGNYPP